MKKTIQIEEDQKELRKLLVLKAVERSDQYNKKINELQTKIDYLFFGITK